MLVLGFGLRLEFGLGLVNMTKPYYLPYLCDGDHNRNLYDDLYVCLYTRGQ